MIETPVIPVDGVVLPGANQGLVITVTDMLLAPSLKCTAGTAKPLLKDIVKWGKQLHPVGLSLGKQGLLTTAESNSMVMCE